jgi:hypothetical protein
VAHLREKNRNPSGKPFPHQHFNSMQSATEGSFPPHQIVSSGRNPVEADLKRKTGEVTFAQGSHLLGSEEHGVGLESNGFKPEGAGTLQYIQPVRVAQRFTAGNAYSVPADCSEFFHESANCLQRHV